MGHDLFQMKRSLNDVELFDPMGNVHQLNTRHLLHQTAFQNGQVRTVGTKICCESYNRHDAKVVKRTFASANDTD
jgi:hypothetical protein